MVGWSRLSNVKRSFNSSRHSSRRPVADTAALSGPERPDRGWSGVVVGEGTRCWYGNRFSLIAPKFEVYGVDLWCRSLAGSTTCATRRTRCS